MHTQAGLLDIHERTHRSLAKLLDHCAGFDAAELDTELDGFGIPTIRLQLQHLIGAERYWVGVLRGEMLVDEEEAEAASIDALRAFRESVAETTVATLVTIPDGDLNTPRTFTTWGDKQVELRPAHVVLRVLTHVFQHQGQIAAQARLLGRPIPSGLDFPLT